MSEKMPDTAPRSRRFFWVFIAIQLVPMAGVTFTPGLSTVWVLVLLGNTCAFFVNLARHTGRSGEPDAKKNRLLFFLIGGIFGMMTFSWCVRLAVKIYASRSLDF